MGSHYDLSDAQQSIRRGGSTRSLQLDYRVMGYSADRGHEAGREAERRAFQWERNQSGGWERRRLPEREETRRRDGEGAAAVALRDRRPSRGHDSCDDSSSSPVYEEYQESSLDAGRSQDSESLYDVLPPTRPAYEGYPSSPPGVNLHPAQLLPPLRAWDLQTGEWRGSREEREPGGLAGPGDELERLLNLVSLRARRATRINRTSTRSEPASDWDGFNMRPE